MTSFKQWWQPIRPWARQCLLWQLLSFCSEESITDSKYIYKHLIKWNLNGTESLSFVAAPVCFKERKTIMLSKTHQVSHQVTIVGFLSIITFHQPHIMLLQTHWLYMNFIFNTHHIENHHPDCDRQKSLFPEKIKKLKHLFFTTSLLDNTCIYFIVFIIITL